MTAPVQCMVPAVDGDLDLRQENARLRLRLSELEFECGRYRNAVDMFQAAAAHDLLSPLQTIFAFSRLLEREFGSGHDYLGFIGQGAERMQLLVQGLLDHTRQAVRPMTVAPVDLRLAISRVVAHLRDEIRQTGAVIDNGDLPAIEGDPELIEILLRNLIDNAIKYRSDAAPHILIEAQSDALCDRLTVTDNGIGLDMEFAEAIFEPLKRLHGPMDRMGAGLGLATCREIARAHGGTVDVAESSGAGSRFRVTLPRRARHGPDTRPDASMARLAG